MKEGIYSYKGQRGALRYGHRHVWTARRFGKRGSQRIGLAGTTLKPTHKFPYMMNRCLLAISASAVRLDFVSSF